MQGNIFSHFLFSFLLNSKICQQVISFPSWYVLVRKIVNDGWRVYLAKPNQILLPPRLLTAKENQFRSIKCTFLYSYSHRDLDRKPWYLITQHRQIVQPFTQQNILCGLQVSNCHIIRSFEMAWKDGQFPNSPPQRPVSLLSLCRPETGRVGPSPLKEEPEGTAIVVPPLVAVFALPVSSTSSWCCHVLIHGQFH